MSKQQFNSQLMDFVAKSPTPFHAVDQMAQQLTAAGFEQLLESDDWQLRAGGRYFISRNGASIVAFCVGSDDLLQNGLRIIGAHTDSPCLKVKPNPELYNKKYFQLGVEVYGGVLLNPWFDRDLSLAGRVTYKLQNGQLKNALIDYKKPIAVIPSLAIHLDREANNSHSVNPQTDIPPILMRAKEENLSFREMLLEQLPAADGEACHVLDYDLSFYDVQPPALVGLNEEFIASARLDNLLSCYVAMRALIKADGKQSCVMVCNDHEEVGSRSAIGAQGPMLKSVLHRLVGSDSQLTRVLDRSMLISVDNAHGIHPNFASRHDGNHGPILNDGPVIKRNANQSYATNSETSSLFRYFAEAAEVPVQNFVVRTDMACGSTIGPITASQLGVNTLDVGVPTFAMHSIRELAGSDDAFYLFKALQFFNCVSTLQIG